MHRHSSESVILIAVSSFLLALRPVHADFGAGTITFDEATYQLYVDDNGTFKTYTTTNGAGTSGYGGVNYSTGVFTVGDDKAVPYDAWFKVDNGGSPVYVRMAFDRSNTDNPTGNLNSIDSGDTPIVIEGTYGGTSAEYSSPLGDVMAYTSVGRADFIESGYETQAGAFFVRARKDNNGNGTETNDAGDEEKWTSFIIEYAGAAVTEATGEIWDIDSNSSQGAEEFTITATGTGTYTSRTKTSPTGLLESDPNGLDAKPWQFAFGSSDGFTDIDQITITRVSGTGYKDYFPLAFNNFNPVSATGYFTPEPSSLLAFGGILSLAMLRRRRRSGAAE